MPGRWLPGLPAVLLPAVLLLAGCAGTPTAPKPPMADFDATIKDAATRLEAALAEEYAPDRVKACLAFPLRTEAARECRDRIVQALMTSVNLRYSGFEAGFFDADRGTDPGAKEGMAAALLTSMRTQRGIADLRIRSGLQHTALEYPFGVALSDVFALYRAGTLPGALTGLIQTVGVQHQEVEGRLGRDGGAALAGLQTGAGTAVPGRAPPPAPPRPPARAPVVPSGSSQTPAAVALQRFVEAPELPPEEAREHRRLIREAAAAEGFGDVVVASFIRDRSPGAEERMGRVARRLRLLP